MPWKPPRVAEEATSRSHAHTAGEHAKRLRIHLRTPDPNLKDSSNSWTTKGLYAFAQCNTNMTHDDDLTVSTEVPRSPPRKRVQHLGSHHAVLSVVGVDTSTDISSVAAEPP